MGRKGSAQGGHTAGGKPAGGGNGPYRLEGLLGPRVEDYVKAHGETDADELVEYLRCVHAGGGFGPRPTPAYACLRCHASAGARSASTSASK